MNIIDIWRDKIQAQHDKDTDLEQQAHVTTTGPKDWVTPADIRRLEEEMVPWLRKKRQAAARRARNT